MSFNVIVLLLALLAAWVICALPDDNDPLD